jgi:hypothetical protein
VVNRPHAYVTFPLLGCCSSPLSLLSYIVVDISEQDPDLGLLGCLSILSQMSNLGSGDDSVHNLSTWFLPWSFAYWEMLVCGDHLFAISYTSFCYISLGEEPREHWPLFFTVKQEISFSGVRSIFHSRTWLPHCLSFLTINTVVSEVHAKFHCPRRYPFIIPMLLPP